MPALVTVDLSSNRLDEVHTEDLTALQNLESSVVWGLRGDKLPMMIYGLHFHDLFHCLTLLFIYFFGGPLFYFLMLIIHAYYTLWCFSPGLQISGLTQKISL